MARFAVSGQPCVTQACDWHHGKRVADGVYLKLKFIFNFIQDASCHAIIP
jgi:hypothetical protein